jgi:Tol biopolymer transport system component
MRLRSIASVVIAAGFLSLATGHAQEAGRSVIPVGSQWPGARPGQLEITDDGRYVLFQSNHGDGWRCFIHDLQQNTTRELADLGDTPYFPEVSPNGQWVSFGKKTWIWKAPLAGGTPVLLHTVNNWQTWETDDALLVTKGANGIWRVKADGSTSVNAEQVAKIDPASGATSYERPSMLPGGRGVLAAVIDKGGTARIGIISLPGGKLTMLDEIGRNPRYSESGHILFTRASALYALPFDLSSLKPTGPSAVIVDGVQVYSNAASQFDISGTGTLVYTPGVAETGRSWPRTLVWVDRQGRERPFDSPAEKFYGMVRLSPDKRYLAAEAGSTFLLFDRQTGTWSVLAEGGNIGSPAWSADSKTVYYSKAGVFGRQSVMPGASWEELWKSEKQFWAQAVLADGTRAIGTDWNPATRMWGLMSVTLTDPRTPGPLLGPAPATRRSPVLSPNGQWIAYVEKTAGMDQVYVQPYPSGGTPVQVSEGVTGEAAEPLWSRFNAELFYRDGAHMVSVQLDLTPTLRVRRRTPLFDIRPYYNYLNTALPVHDYDATTDRFLMLRNVIPELPGEDIVVIRNAFELLNRLAPKK